MRFEPILAWRQLRGRRQNRSLSVITWLAVLGVVFGVIALVSGFSLTTGFEKAFQDKILGITSHVFIRDYGLFFSNYRETAEKAGSVEGVVGTSPITFNEAMLSGDSTTAGAIVKGIIPERASKVLALDEYMVSGKLADLGGRDADGLNGLILGTELARKLNVKVGDALTMISPLKSFSPERWSAKADAPTTMVFRVRGIFEAGFYEYDSRLVYMELSTAQNFFGSGDAVIGIEVAVKDPLKAGEIANAISEEVGRDDFSVMEWRKQNKNLFMSLTYQRLAILVVLSVMVVLASCNVAIMLIMLVIERTKDIAILKTMGATSSSIMRIFIYEGLIIGVLGTVIGMLGAYFFCEVILQNGVTLDPKVYGISKFPAVFDVMDYVMAGGGALLITFFATIFPALRGAHYNPVDGLRETHS